MKRATALMLAIMLLMSGISAFAESSGTRFDIEKIRISLLDTPFEDESRIHGISMAVAVGSAEGVPTLQASLFYGDGQQLDGVVQVVGNRLYMCAGGISGTFYVDLDDLLDEGQNKLVSAAIGSALLMVGSNPQMVIQMFMKASKSGIYTKKIQISAEQYRTYVQPVIDALIDTGALSDNEQQALRNSMGDSDKPVKIKFRYNPKSGRFHVRLTRGNEGLKLRFTMEMTTEPMEFINIRDDEVQYDLLNLDQEVIDELRVELDFLGFKMGSYAESNDINKLTGNSDK